MVKGLRWCGAGGQLHWQGGLGTPEGLLLIAAWRQGNPGGALSVDAAKRQSPTKAFWSEMLLHGAPLALAARW
eukprot:4687805-Heterocapsa_arctica.AAC.1